MCYFPAKQVGGPESAYSRNRARDIPWLPVTTENDIASDNVPSNRSTRQCLIVVVVVVPSMRLSRAAD